MFDKIKTHYLLLLLIIIAVALFLFYLKLQPQLSHTYSSLFDANKYLKVYNFFKGEKILYEVPFPVNSRILVPWLASWLPFEDPTKCFLIINFIGIILSIITIYLLWTSLGVSQEFIFTGFFWLLVHWVGIIRLNIFDPITVDVYLYLFQTLLLLVLIKKQFFWLLLLAPVATLQKESFIGLMIVSTLAGIYLFRKSQLNARDLIILTLALILSIVTKELANYFFPPLEDRKNSLIIILFHTRETIMNPFRLVRWLIGVFTAFGPMLILAVWYKTSKKDILKGNLFIAILSLTYLGLSLLGGGDFARLAFLGFPFIMTWIMTSLGNIRVFLFRIAFIMGLPLMKLFRNIPDPALAGWDRFYNFYPEFANPIIVLLWLGYGFLCVLVFKTIHKKLSMLP